jgi:deoxyribose-phosphate aldolase
MLGMPIEKNISSELVQKIYSLIDLTSLNETDDSAKISELCTKAILSVVPVAAVCVYPQFIPDVKKALRGTAVKIATVANFPSGNDSLESVVATIHAAIAQGAQEVDVVFPYSRFLANDKKFAEEFIRACKSACGKHTLKVILETGALRDLAIIAEASELAIAAGADFLKTSTGKISIGATFEAAAVMLTAIKKKSNGSVGFKASGGIRTITQAEDYIALAECMMGEDWVSPLHFRIGVSQFPK